MSKRKQKKNPYTDWGGASQGKAFKQMRKTQDRTTKKMLKTMKKGFNAATEDFGTLDATQKKAFTPGQKITIGSISSKKARKPRKKTKRKRR